MFVNRLLNQGNAPILEQVVRFTGKRHELIAENIANISTPNYRQKDLDVQGFYESLRSRVASRAGRPTSSVRFDDVPMDEAGDKQNLLFHDGSNRSAEGLMADLAKNALTYNLSVELLRRQFNSIKSALKERVE